MGNRGPHAPKPPYVPKASAWEYAKREEENATPQPGPPKQTTVPDVTTTPATCLFVTEGTSNSNELFEKVPDDLFIHYIFPWLDQYYLFGKMVFVCKRWTEAVYKTASELDLSPPRTTPFVNYQFLLDITKRLPNVITANLADCTGIDDDSLEIITTQWQLVSLSVFNCPDITDAGLLHLTGQSNLQRLNIGENHNITDEGLRPLLHKFPLLKVECMFCNLISSEFKIRLMALS